MKNCSIWIHTLVHSNSAALSIAIHQWILSPTPLVRTHAAPSEHLLHAVPQAIRKTRLAWGARRRTADFGYVRQIGSHRAHRTPASWRRRRGVCSNNNTRLSSTLFLPVGCRHRCANTRTSCTTRTMHGAIMTGTRYARVVTHATQGGEREGTSLASTDHAAASSHR